MTALSWKVAMAKRILSVDDSPALRQASFDLLRRAGYSVGLAENGRDALEKLRSFAPDLILLDIDMPHLDGWEFLELADRQGHLEGVLVVILSGLPLAPDATGEMADRYVCYVTKRASGSELLEVIERVFAGDPTPTDHLDQDAKSV